MEELEGLLLEGSISTKEEKDKRGSPSFWTPPGPRGMRGKGDIRSPSRRKRGKAVA